MEHMAKQMFFKLFILLICYKITIVTCDIRLVPCSVQLPITNTNCTISGLTLSLKDYKFKPVASDLSIVIGFEIKKSTVPVITSEICTALPKLKWFVATQQGIQVIEDYAFNNCTEVLLISIPFNNIHKLGKGIFDNTKKLLEINLHGGSLEEFDVNLFDNLGEMNELVISANKLKELPLSALKNVKKMTILYLYSNELSDLDAEGLVASLPMLKAVYINDNNFQCDRLKEIIDIFKAKNILIVDHTHSIYLKKRDYIPHKINNIICLSQAEFESEKMKKALTSSLDELKDVPIGKAVIQLKDLVNSGLEDASSNIMTLFNLVNGTSEELNQQIFYINQTLNDTTRRIQEIADKIDLIMEKSSTFNSNASNNFVIWILFTCLLLIIVVVISFFVYKKFRSGRVDVPFLHYKNSAIYLGDDEHHQIST